jgi:hypothetical protein
VNARVECKGYMNENESLNWSEYTLSLLLSAEFCLCKIQEKCAVVVFWWLDDLYRGLLTRGRAGLQRM